ncbi:MAG: hypothetical protein ACRDPS_01490 [Nocardioides sp.]|uniref:hypothetical protein n=1 Tax=Nocardioides sp. TaxID=35761 RepID=UPI003D6C17A2
MPPTISASLAWDAVTALLTPAMPAGASVYAPGTVPGADGNAGTLPQKWMQLTLERRFTETAHVGRTRTAFRAYLRAVADNEHNADDILTRGCEAIEEALLVIDGETSTPVAHETTQAVKPDDGKHSGMASYTFTL